MSEKSWPRRHWKLILNVITLVALFILIFAIRDEIGGTIRDLHHVHAWVLLLMIPLELLNYHAQTKVYQRLFAIVGNKLSYRHLFKTSLELNFVNHVFPSGGVTGMSYFTLRLRKGDELSSGKATFVHVMKIALYFLAFEIILAFGVLCLAVMGRTNGFVILVAGSLSTLLFVGTAGFMFIIGSKQRINNFFGALTKGLNRLIKLVRPRNPEALNMGKARRIFNDFHDSYLEIRSNYRQLKMPFFYALVADLTEILTLYVVYIAFGEWVNVGAVILAYGIANFAGLISVIPGGVGIYEGLMTAVLAATGVPPRISLPVTIMYRILNTLLQLPPGYYLYHRAIRQNKLTSGDVRGN